MKQGTPADKRRAVELRAQGLSYAKIAKQLGFSEQTVTKWIKAAEAKIDKPKPYVLAADPDPEPEPETVGHVVEIHGDITADDLAGDMTEISVTKMENYDADLEALKAELAAKDAEIDQLRSDRDRYKPTVDIHHLFFDTEADLDRFYSDDQYREMVQNRLDEINMANAKRNRPAVRMDQPGVYDQMLKEVKDSLLSGSLGKVHDGPWTRKIKFAKPNARDENGEPVFDLTKPLEIVGLPLEPQVNNTAGSLADGIVRYTQKGFKLTEPFICPAGPCFRAAALTDFGKWAHEGYCSQEHHDRIENALRTRVDENRSMVGIAVSSVR